MRVEVLIFLYMFAYALRMVSQTTIIMDKVCLVHFNHSSSICSNISDYPDIKNEVVKLANNYIIGYNLLSFLPASILVTFIGSWSDKYSRKIPLFIALMGMLLDDILITLLSIFMNTRVEYLFVPAFLNGFSGSFVAITAIAYSYISDASTPSNRTMKYTLFQASYGFAMPIGVLASGYIFMYYGYVSIFSLATAVHVLALLWLLFAVAETRGFDCKETWPEKIRNLFSTENVILSFRVAMKNRPNNGKRQIFLLTLCMSLTLLHQASLGAIGFSYAHHRYSWDNTKYSTVFGIIAVIGTFSSVVIVPLFKRMKLGDVTLGLVGSVSTIGRSVLTGLASKEFLFYAGNVTGALGILVPLAARSRISKIASKDEMGKIFSFLSMVETSIPFIFSAAVTQIFNATLDFFPGLIFIILGVMSISQVVVFWWISRLPKPSYDENDDPANKMENKEPIFFIRSNSICENVV
ncbi:proton-coupled folate transporter-like [Uloborus diversus]|uniref:proton-coupled folate transporter-like n=1 Tax=Uloborus diversus TaxID=327109 RepID=UPI002409E31D|nr:proton-coupled folate transporter-like [Uloborus diversus]